ncbi:hypothetical protein FSP39_014558 [Pinctada imbricata]|uniref:SGNH hydrolase-type esterase domain-containing protein n=1 Tax=Pinctada imbricata TaxID=66713 RepID=A0AA89BZE8_PINIB|nr:hypothetical protein FSP39_014558 [Pinctada imbricata]
MAACTVQNVAILGHSYIRRLGEFIQDNPDCTNMRLDRERFNICIRGVGGLRVQQLANSREILTFDTKQDICFIQIGGNDLSNSKTPVHTIVEWIMSFAQFLIQGKEVKSVLIGQLLRRHPWKVGRSYNERVIQTNKLLHRACTQRDDNIQFWHHRGFWDPELSFLGRDGVHIRYSKHDQKYMRKYMQSIRSAVLHASNKISPSNGKLNQMSMIDV